MNKLIVNRPWGRFDQFTKNESTTVKIITINSGGSLSLQFHKNRSEFWHIISGSPYITIDDKNTQANPGDEFMIEKLQKHRIEAPQGEVQFLEIAFGDFDEDDIIRLKDKYGRA